MSITVKNLALDKLQMMHAEMGLLVTAFLNNQNLHKNELYELREKINNLEKQIRLIDVDMQREVEKTDINLQLEHITERLKTIKIHNKHNHAETENNFYTLVVALQHVEERLDYTNLRVNTYYEALMIAIDSVKKEQHETLIEAINDALSKSVPVSKAVLKENKKSWFHKLFFIGAKKNK